MYGLKPDDILTRRRLFLWDKLVATPLKKVPKWCHVQHSTYGAGKEALNVSWLSRCHCYSCFNTKENQGAGLTHPSKFTQLKVLRWNQADQNPHS